MFLEHSQNNKQIIDFVSVNLFKSRDIKKDVGIIDFAGGRKRL
jgi:hypothetical protein